MSSSNYLTFFIEMKNLTKTGLASAVKDSKEASAKIIETFKGIDSAMNQSIGYKMQQKMKALKVTASEFADKTKGAFNEIDRSGKHITYSINDLKEKLRQASEIRFNAIGKEFDNATKRCQNLENHISRLSKYGKSGAGNIVPKIERSIPNKNIQRRGILSNMFGGNLMQQAAGLLPAVGLAGALSFGASSVKAANQFEQTKTQYSVLTGSKAGGDALANDLRSMKENTVMGTAVYDNARTMLAFGVNAKNIKKDLEMLGDVSLGNANRLQHLTLAFSEVQTQGKLTGKELRQMALQGFNPLAEIARTTGKSMVALRHDMHDGKITANMVTQAFASATGEGGRFHGMLDKMGETGAGKMAKLQGSIASLKIAFGQVLTPSINQALTPLTKFILGLKHFVEIPTEKVFGDQIIKIRALQTELTATNTSHGRQIQLLHELEELNPNLTKGIDEQRISYQKLAENIDNVTGSLRNKIFLESFNKSKASTIGNFGQAQTDKETAVGNIMAAIGHAPAIAQNNTMTMEQKQIAAHRYFSNIVNKDAEGKHWYQSGAKNQRSPEAMEAFKALRQLEKAIEDGNGALGVIKKLQPEMNSINKTKDVLTNSINKYVGPSSFKKEKMPDGGEAPKKENVASGITSGGPRVINIKIGKFLDNININVNKLDESTQEIEAKVEDIFLRVLNSGASVQN